MGEEIFLLSLSIHLGALFRKWETFPGACDIVGEVVIWRELINWNRDRTPGTGGRSLSGEEPGFRIRVREPIVKDQLEQSLNLF